VIGSNEQVGHCRLPDAAVRKNILVDNPARLHEFEKNIDNKLS